MNMKRTVLSMAIFIAMAVFVIPAAAHHGAANYDSSAVATIQGTVADFQFINPHVLIYVDVKDPSGKVERWTCEATSPNLLYRRGWTKTTIKPGDQITLSGNKAKNGVPLLRLMKLVVNGREYGDL
jgi:hypothetical protein